MTEKEIIQKIYEVIKLVDCLQYNPSVDFNYLRAKGAYNIIKNRIEQIESENTELRATLSKMEKVENAVDLPCKVGDNIYVRYYNNKEKRHCIEVERVSKTNFNITDGILSGTVYTYDFSKRHEEDNCYNMRDYNKKWFTDRVAAEASSCGTQKEVENERKVEKRD